MLSDLKPDHEMSNANPLEHEDETIPVSVFEDIDSLFGRMVNFSRRLCSRETTHALVEKKGEANDRFYAMEKLVEKLKNVEEKDECKKLKKELEEARLSNTFLRMQNERVKRDLYWTRVRAHEFYQEMIHRGFVFEEKPNEAIDVPIEDEKSPLSEPVNAAIAAERARQANVRNDTSGSGPAMGRDTAPVVHECTFVGFMKCNPAAFRGVKGAVELRRWFKKTKSVFEISECDEGKKVKFVAATLEGPALTWWKTKVTFNELALMCLRMVEPESVKVDAYIRGLTDNIKGEVTSSRLANLNEANNQKQGNARAMTTAPTDGKCRREVMAKFLEWSSGQATWSGGQDVGVVPKGLEWWPRVLLGAQGSNF
ncbi:hypothetical protein Tco_1054076 [Tanacetum coccineum]|uniref:Zinc finger, CCHC-type, retrotransposon Gag domain protein n=1 Tax=Tanacetum coccineum TaxID=301880 RepID=A0ABQ5GW64_9ASTR